MSIKELLQKQERSTDNILPHAFVIPHTYIRGCMMFAEQEKGGLAQRAMASTSNWQSKRTGGKGEWATKGGGVSAQLEGCDLQKGSPRSAT